jgi:hypothetical protein
LIGVGASLAGAPGTGADTDADTGADTDAGTDTGADTDTDTGAVTVTVTVPGAAEGSSPVATCHAESAKSRGDLTDGRVSAASSAPQILRGF